MYPCNVDSLHTTTQYILLEPERGNTSAHALAFAHADSGRIGAGGGGRGRGREGRRSAKRHDAG